MGHVDPQEKTEQDEKYEKLGSAVMGIAWFLYALKFIAAVSVVALVVLWLIHKPLWIAPIVGVMVFTVCRIIWRSFFRFVRWATKDKQTKE
jgi:Flp pilus assembly protein TadB